MLHATLDVSRAVFSFAPPSVEYFLCDLVNGIEAEPVKLVDLLTQVGPVLATHEEGKAMLAENGFGADGRMSWLERAVRKSTATFEPQTGVAAEFTATPGDFAVRFYRELQIRKLLAPRT